MKIPWSRKWQPTPVFLPGKFHGQRMEATVHGVTKSWIGLSTHTQTHMLDKTSLVIRGCGGVRRSIQSS